MSAAINGAKMAGIPHLTIRAADPANVVKPPSEDVGTVTVIDARAEPDPAKWAAAIPAIRSASLICTVRSAFSIDQYATEMAKRGDRVLVIVCDEIHAPRWRALRATYQRSVSSWGMTRAQP